MPQDNTDHLGPRGTPMNRCQVGMAIAAGAYLVGFGLLMGVAVDRIRFDRQRSEVLGRYEEALREWQAYRMAFEKDAGARR
jgi:hypothetical protein